MPRTLESHKRRRTATTKVSSAPNPRLIFTVSSLIAWTVVFSGKQLVHVERVLGEGGHDLSKFWEEMTLGWSSSSSACLCPSYPS